MSRHVYQFSVAALASILVSGPAFSEAYERRVPGSACAVVGTAGYLGAFMSTEDTSVGGFGTCPIISDTTAPFTTFTSANVRVYDGNVGNNLYEYFYTSACVRDSSSTTSYCGTPATSAGLSGYLTLSPSTSYWTSTYSTWYPYISVAIPRKNGSALSYLFGYVVSD